MGDVISLNKGQKIRCFIIADDYRWHVLTTSIEEFAKYTESYLELMARSGKENQYYFKNIFMTQNEYLETKKLMGQAVSNQKTKKRHLELVVD